MHQGHGLSHTVNGEQEGGGPGRPVCSQRSAFVRPGQARSMYLPVRVSTRFLSPFLMNSGTLRYPTVAEIRHDLQ
jgi:hypothetical protein